MRLHSEKLRIKNRKFYNGIRGIKKDKLLGVAIDWSKSFHKVMIFDFNGKILVKPFEIDTLRSGYDKLISMMQKTEKKIKDVQLQPRVDTIGSF